MHMKAKNKATVRFFFSGGGIKPDGLMLVKK